MLKEGIHTAFYFQTAENDSYRKSEGFESLKLYRQTRACIASLLWCLRPEDYLKMPRDPLIGLVGKVCCSIPKSQPR